MSTAPITRDDIEAKFRELQTEVDDTVEQSMGIVVIAGVAAVVGLVAVAFVLGRRRGRKRTTVVEIRRV
jgi:signal transduction histidine kinase